MVSVAAESTSFQEFLSDFKETVETHARRLLLLTEAQADERAAPEKWSRKEIIGHLIDSASNNHQRFVRAQFTNDLVFPGYEQEAWVAAQCYAHSSWSQLVELWKLYNLHLAHVAEHIPEDVLTRKRAEHNLDRIAWQTVAKLSPVTLEYFIRDYAGHMRQHLKQIFALIET